VLFFGGILCDQDVYVASESEWRSYPYLGCSTMVFSRKHELFTAAIIDFIARAHRREKAWTSSCIVIFNGGRESYLASKVSQGRLIPHVALRHAIENRCPTTHVSSAGYVIEAPVNG
jgi:hypothetical protein